MRNKYNKKEEQLIKKKNSRGVYKSELKKEPKWQQKRKSRSIQCTTTRKENKVELWEENIAKSACQYLKRKQKTEQQE